MNAKEIAQQAGQAMGLYDRYCELFSDVSPEARTGEVVAGDGPYQILRVVWYTEEGLERHDYYDVPVSVAVALLAHPEEHYGEIHEADGLPACFR